LVGRIVGLSPISTIKKSEAFLAFRLFYSGGKKSADQQIRVQLNFLTSSSASEIEAKERRVEYSREISRDNLFGQIERFLAV